MARSDFVKQTVYVPRALKKRLDEVSSAPGVSQTKIIAEALANWLERKGASELELRFAKRLDRLSNQLTRIERNGHVELESLALFIRYMLTVTAPIPEGDDAARAVGKDRFAAFVERVGRKLVTGRLTLLPEEEP